VESYVVFLSRVAVLQRRGRMPRAVVSGWLGPCGEGPEGEGPKGEGPEGGGGEGMDSGLTGESTCQLLPYVF